MALICSVFECDTDDLTIQAALAGTGIALVAEKFIDRELMDGRLIPDGGTRSVVSLGYDAMQVNNKTPCPFLSEQGSCTIYQSRPLLCRTYHVSSDPVLCGTPGAYIVQYGSVEANMGNRIFHAVLEWIIYQNQHAAKGKMQDIRNFFPYPKHLMQEHIAKQV